MQIIIRICHHCQRILPNRIFILLDVILTRWLAEGWMMEIMSCGFVVSEGTRYIIRLLCIAAKWFIVFLFFFSLFLLTQARFYTCFIVIILSSHCVFFVRDLDFWCTGLTVASSLVAFFSLFFFFLCLFVLNIQFSPGEKSEIDRWVLQIEKRGKRSDHSI